MPTYRAGQLVDVVIDGIGVRRGTFLSDGVPNRYVNVKVTCRPPFGYDPPLCEFESRIHPRDQTHHIYRVKADHIHNAERAPLTGPLTADDLYPAD